MDELQKIDIEEVSRHKLKDEEKHILLMKTFKHKILLSFKFQKNQGPDSPEANVPGQIIDQALDREGLW